jgi:glycosyltransferase involved in cell wall biosynthesis
MLREIVSLADHIVCLSIEEMQRISKGLGVLNKPFSLVRNAADYGAFGNASPDWFVSTYGIQNFVLCVGRIEARKNQAMLLYSLRESSVPVVFVGQTGEPDYEQLCRALAPRGTLFINQLNRNELASAYAAAKVCALPSWAEGASLSNLEAAAARCPLVVSNRASEFEYFGDAVRYCDPANWHSIAEAVINAVASFDAEKGKREELRNRLISTCTWEAAAAATLRAYERAIGEYK